MLVIAFAPALLCKLIGETMSVIASIKADDEKLLCRPAPATSFVIGKGVDSTTDVIVRLGGSTSSMNVDRNTDRRRIWGRRARGRGCEVGEAEHGQWQTREVDGSFGEGWVGRVGLCCSVICLRGRI